MAVAGEPCPEIDELAAFASGELSGKRAHVVAHLDRCDECRRVVAAAAAISDHPAEATPTGPTGPRVGRFVIQRVLGEGAMGVVHLAYDPELKRSVAVKLIKPDSGDELARERLLVEAQTAAQLSHPNAVTVYDVGLHEGQPYVAMEYVEGTTVASWLRQGAGWREALIVMLAAGEGLAAAHSAGLVHRDFKPDNVLLGGPGVVKVSDFGLARFGDDRIKSIAAHEAALALPRSSRAQTETGVLVGTPAYTSPEQFAGAPATAASDQFAFGVAVYRALYGVRPFRAPTLYAMYEAITNEPPPAPPRDARAPSALWPIVERALSKQPADRFPSMRDLLTALRDASGLAQDTLVVERCPFPGLVSFAETDARLYFGRAAEVNEVLGKLRDQSVAAVVGPSGAGKSSFVRALVIPRLRRDDASVEVLAMRPGAHPLLALARAIGPLASSPDARTVDELAARLAERPEQVATWLHAHVRQHDTRVVLYVDQLEEVYTQCADRAERLAFARSLASLAEPGRALRLCVSVRSDFLDRVAESGELMARVTAGFVFLAPPGRTTLAQALSGPLVAVGYELEDPRIADEVAGELEDQPGAFPLLQFVGGRLWDARDRERKLVTRASLEAIGAVAGALAVHADLVLSQLTPADATLARAVLLRLVTPERTRLAVPVAELEHLGAGVARVVDVLVRGRLLVADGDTVELVHEALIGAWPTLRRWLDDEAGDARLLADLGASARRWDKAGQPEGMLWTGDPARQIVALRARGGELTALETAFVGQTERLLRREGRRRRILAAAALGIASAIAIVATIAYVKVASSEQRAVSAADDATKAAAEAEIEAKNARAAEAKAQKALDDLVAANRAKDAADAEKVAATKKAALADEQVKLSAEQLLQRKNELERALALADERRKTAEAAVETEKTTRKALDKALKEAQAARDAAERRYRDAISKLPPKDPL